jgi:hypothetical protein
MMIEGPAYEYKKSGCPKVIGQDPQVMENESG